MKYYYLKLEIMRTSARKKTNRAKLFLIGCGTALITFVTGCSEDSVLNPNGNCFGGKWAEQYAGELQTWSDASVAYSQDPTPANCAKYKTAAKSYLDALREIVDCVPTASKAEIDQSINEAKADVDKEGCN